MFPQKTEHSSENLKWLKEFAFLTQYSMWGFVCLFVCFYSKSFGWIFRCAFSIKEFINCQSEYIHTYIHTHTCMCAYAYFTAFEAKGRDLGPTITWTSTVILVNLRSHRHKPTVGLQLPFRRLFPVQMLKRTERSELLINTLTWKMSPYEQCIWASQIRGLCFPLQQFTLWWHRNVKDNRSYCWGIWKTEIKNCDFQTKKREIHKTN